VLWPLAKISIFLIQSYKEQTIIQIYSIYYSIYYWPRSAEVFHGLCWRRSWCRLRSFCAAGQAGTSQTRRPLYVDTFSALRHLTHPSLDCDTSPVVLLRLCVCLTPVLDGNFVSIYLFLVCIHSCISRRIKTLARMSSVGCVSVMVHIFRHVATTSTVCTYLKSILSTTNNLATSRNCV
jgi:hypothetical protein